MNNQVDNHGSTETATNEEPKKGWRKVLKRAVSWLSYKNKDEWLKEMRGNMGIMATFIATITFQIALNPPGGVRPVRDDGDQNPDQILCDNAIDDLKLCPGEAVLAVIYPDDYFQFLLWNTICFIASLSVCLLLVTGIRSSHRISMWLLSMGMCLILTSLVLTYRFGVSMVTPDPIWAVSENLLTTLLDIWIKLFFFLAVLLTLRIIIWGVKDILKKGKRATTPKVDIPPA